MQVSGMLKQFEDRIASQGLDLEQYFQMTNTSEEDFRQDMWPEAEKTVKVNFLLEKIIEEKGIEIADEELDNRIADIAANMKMDADQAKQNLAGIRDNLTYNLKLERAIQYLVDKAEISEQQPDSAETDTDREAEEEKE
jgi:trigger factor